MTKTTKTVVSDEAALSRLVERISPGSVSLVKPAYSISPGAPAFEMTIQTRESQVTFVGATIAEVTEDALLFVDDPNEDPFVPHWSRLTRMQREVVVQTLREHGARQMARAAEAKLTHSPEAHSLYEIADAFQAGVTALEHGDFDERGAMHPRETLSAPKPAVEPIKATMPRKKSPTATT